MSGHEFLAELERCGEHPARGIPIIVMSAAGGAVLAQVRDRVTACYGKPLDFAEPLFRVRRILY